jgi:hypothetical protein
MTRSLLLVAGCGFVATLLCFALVLMSGPVDWSDWTWDGPDFGHRGPPVYAGGPTITRTLAWSGDSGLSVNIPAEVTYTQGPAGTVVVTGPQGAVEHFVVEGDRLKFDRRMRRVGRLQIAVTAPDVREFTLAGSQRLTIQGYDQDRLELRMFGSGDVKAVGRARHVELAIAGSGDADLGGIAADEAEVNIAGSGDSVVSPKESAEIHIAGSGDVTLTTRPARLEQHVAGSGRIVQGAAN